MGVPSKAETEQALAEAIRMREQGQDEHHLAKVLLNLNYRFHLMEDAIAAAKHFLHSGLAPHEHARLVKAIAAVESAGQRPATEKRKDFGLE
ncbi:MAG: hypothetical protein ACKO4A_02865 [Gammaproteobacteria bacterium]